MLACRSTALIAMLAQTRSPKCFCAWQVNAAKQQQAAAQKLSKQQPIAAEASARLASREAEGIGQAQLSAPHGKAGARVGRKRGRDTGSIALDKPARKRQPPPRYSACCPTSPSPPPPPPPAPRLPPISLWQIAAMSARPCIWW